MQNTIIQFIESQENITKAVIAFAISVIILLLIKYSLISRLKKVSAQTKTPIDDSIINHIKNIGVLFYLTISFYIASTQLNFEEKTQSIITGVTIAIAASYIIRVISKVMNDWVSYVIKKKTKENDNFNPATYNIFNFFVKVAIWITVMVIILQNFGINITGLIAGLGVGGVAVAFALQSILGDIFSYFSIHFDRPFKVGDYISVGNFDGTVKKIGIKSTRLATVQGEELVVPNNKLTNTEVQNYKKMTDRTVIYELSIKDNITATKLKELPAKIKKELKEIETITVNNVHIQIFNQLGIGVRISYKIPNRTFKSYLSAEQKVTLKLKQLFTKEKIEIVYIPEALQNN